MTLNLYILLYLYVFWAFYVLVMGLYRAHLANRLNTFTKIMGTPIIVIGIFLDVLANLTIATLVFLELPKEWLVTTRLVRYQENNTDYRKKLAQLICDNLLDPFDPSGNHC